MADQFTKTVTPCRFEAVWDVAGNPVGASVSYALTMTDVTLGESITTQRGPVALDVTNQTVKTELARLYALLPDGGQ